MTESDRTNSRENFTAANLLGLVPPREFNEGDRVQHVHVDLHGTVVRSDAAYTKVRWDYYGLAVAALGSMADLQKTHLLEREVESHG